MLKRAMDVFYASVGTAMSVAKGRSASDWQLVGATAAASSYYSILGTGASQRVAAATSSSQSAKELIRNAWGMVSLPAVKNLSLQASRFLKGAAIAERIEICGTSCFILSKDPAPELLAATVLHQRSRVAGLKKAVLSLPTIDERQEHTPRPSRNTATFARSCSKIRQRDVIFHLTGGGFFAHIIATDLPFLLDWSGYTGAVVICPEYALLPQHTYPDALNEVTRIYEALVTGEASPLLGFEVNRIVVTGESAGGNLAAALCVKLSQQANENLSAQNSQSNGDREYSNPPPHLPDALMLSCPVLNLTSETSPSRVAGILDPVLPGCVISAISEAYCPPHIGISRRDPLVSPVFSSDEILRRFPPTLLIASSNDPMLDDSVVFNRRLESLGVDTRFKAAQNLPHAYLGLGTAGFPEATQIQQECQRWLAFQFSLRDASQHNCQ
jgi:acetyl esterase